MEMKKILEEIDYKAKLIKDDRKKKVITSILKKDKWYNELNFDTILSIMLDLGYNKQQAIDIYKYLIINK